jgi:hypothetical protein
MYLQFFRGDGLDVQLLDHEAVGKQMLGLALGSSHAVVSVLGRGKWAELSVREEEE